MLTNIIMDTDKLKKIITNFYGIYEPFDCKFIRRSFNDHYLIQTKNHKYILRVYLNNKYYIYDKNDFKFELDLLSFLASKNVPVSSSLRNKEGLFLSEFLYNKEKRFIAMFSFAEGEQINTSLDSNLALCFGENIANLHKVSNEFKSKHYRYKIDLNYLIIEPIEMLKQYCSKHKFESLNFFMPYAKYLYRELQELPVNSDAYGIIHGDLNPSNIHLDYKGNLTIFDFDHCAYGWRIHDLAVIKLCYDENTYEAILDGYTSKISLSKTEERLIELYAKTLIIRKYKDVLSILKISDNDISEKFDEREFISSAIDTLHNLMKG
ncbi:phosphotransferase [Hathewaya massiliensis]|uniref:phosphotransferase n=1 Tax=Hathewaya massiliensis TaxID=1964382 RepID=UPI001FAA5F9F|nr:phosphotransferase [Hathewaya massiliensis]